MASLDENPYVRWLENLKSEDVAIVGGKNASLGELIQSLKAEGVQVTGSF
jgi:pyruvate, water dikinase